MDVEKVFHMTGGTGFTSYTKNSSLQKKVSNMVKHITLETVEELCVKTKPKSLGIADLGCSSGPNTLSIIRDIIESVQEGCRRTKSPAPEWIHIHLNDLPSNDFNSIFKSLPDDLLQRDHRNSMVFVGAYPGSFYHRLFPSHSIHFVYASYSLHWLSKVPRGLYDEKGKSINKGAIYISEKSPGEVSEVYLEQFKEDFCLFLRLRSEEVVSGGKMVLTVSGRVGTDRVYRGNPFLWELLSRSLAVLVTEGVIEEEKLDSYDCNFYAPAKEELEDEVKREGSFELERLEIFEAERDEKGNGLSYGTKVSRAVRAIQESMLSHHFGEAILDKLFEIYGKMIDEEMAIEEIRPITLVTVLTKL